MKKRLQEHEWLEMNNITNDTIFIIRDCNTYKIKDELKSAGARYNPDLGWFFGLSSCSFNTKTPEYKLPEDGHYQEIKYSEYFDWGYDTPVVKDEKRVALKKMITFVDLKALKSEFYGEVGARIRKVDAVFKSVRWWQGEWGGSFIYTFEYDSNIFIWFTQSGVCANMEEGTKIILSGTIKDHKEYKGIKQTYLSRCIIKER